MTRCALALCAAAALSLGVWATAHAFGCRPDLVPSGDVYRCATCHVSSGGGGRRNPFGEAVADVAFGCDPFWGPDLARADADEDGRTNGEELGDPEGAWRPGDPAPLDPSLVTHPGVPDEPPGLPRFIRGDLTGDGALDVSDPVAALGHLFLGGAHPTCAPAADSNGDGSTDVADAVYSLLHLFAGGAPPPAPYPECGEAPAGTPCETTGACR